MKITKFPQSCFMIESGEKTILVDPGNLSFDDSFMKDWKRADFILITHKHGDHCFSEKIESLGKPIYSTAEVQATYPNLKINIVKVGALLHLSEGIEVAVVEAIHGYIPILKGNGEIHENVGYIISAEDKKIYFTSDTICFKNEYKCDILCAPVSAHGLVMSPFEVSLFSKECGASLVLPCHMDNPKFPVDLEKMKEIFDSFEINYRVLEAKESLVV